MTSYLSKKSIQQRAAEYARETASDDRLAIDLGPYVDSETQLMRDFEEGEMGGDYTPERLATAADLEWSPPADPDALPF